ISLKANDILFRENDESDCMYVVKKGRIAITKTKGASEIILAELGPGSMLGEMAFFDSKPRSAGAKALSDTEVIALPFVALHAQFKTFPEWLKSMVKTVNGNLREANRKIKNLEQVQNADATMFPPETILKLTAIITLIGFKSGEQTEEGLVIPAGTLRNYTIQIFHQPTHKMNKLIEVLSALQLMKQEDLGEGRIKITILDQKKLTGFVDWYNKWLFAKDADRITLEEKELPAARALCFYGRKQEPNDKGQVTVSLTELQNNSMKDFNQLINVSDTDSLAAKGFIEEKVSGEGGVLTTNFVLQDLEMVIPYWEIIYTLSKIKSH
ncbi:MAG: cyclic nucleotide-binding domain-containing protein, partial [Bdellovibrionales bacterium]|nr:cyclic nucleotide-binding domain-containing protein [Bdellovibrionales bacterium]